MTHDTSTIAGRLAALGITLQPAGPAAVWQLPSSIDEHGLVHTCGQVPALDGELFDVGGPLLGEDDVERGRRAARQSAIDVLAQLDAVAGGLENVVRVHKLTVFVASGPRFTWQPQVAHGASELVHEVLGEPGRHARSAIGVAQLPHGVPVETEAVARVRVPVSGG